MKKRLIPFLILVICYTFAGLTQPTKNSKPIRVHFVGNSYTYYQNLAQVVAIMAKSRGIDMVTSKSTIGGATLSEHWYNGSADKPLWNINTKDKLRSGNFDLVILQDMSMNPVSHPDSTLKYVHLFSDLIKNLRAKPLLYLTWAKEKTPQTQEQITSTYLRAAKANDLKIAPVGEAWKLARSLRPDLKLFADDGTHPSYIGAYLTACTFFATLTEGDPVGLPRVYRTEDKFGESIELMLLDAELAKFLQTVARDAVASWKQTNK